MRECWRWFGEDDPVTLSQVKQAGASGIVSALHSLYDGTRWPQEDVDRRHDVIRAAGLSWDVVESIPVHNDIKIAGPRRRFYIDQYKDTIRAIAATGVKIICYNFMPVIDWARTDLTWLMPTTGYALRFDAIDFAAYDIFALERPDAAAAYSESRIREAEARFHALPADAIASIERNLIAGLPATERNYDRASFREALLDYAAIGHSDLQANLFHFLAQIVPVAEELDVRLCIHPDDPPFPLFGLPRIVSTAADARAILAAVDT
ncbi:MAG: mannonate dehydratase, partial [Phyllobacterium sp.]